MGTEALTDCVIFGLVGVALWLWGFMELANKQRISIPLWLSRLCGKGRRRWVYLRPLAFQLLGLFTVTWIGVLAIAVPSHDQRMQLYAWGFLVFMCLDLLFVMFMEHKLNT